MARNELDPMATFTGEEMDYRQKGGRAPKESRKEGDLPDTREVAKRALAPRHSQEMAPDITRSAAYQKGYDRQQRKDRLYNEIVAPSGPYFRAPVGAGRSESVMAVTDFISESVDKGLSDEEIMTELESLETRRALGLKDAHPPEDIRTVF